MEEMKLPILVIIFIFLSQVCFAQDDGMNVGIIYGSNYVFSLKAPDGWVLDNTSGQAQGLQAVFYPKGETWNNATTVMYANTASLENEAHKTLNLLIKYDLDTFKKNYSGIAIADGKDVVIKKDVIAKIKHLSGKSYGNFEAMAYIDAGKNSIMIVMSSRTRDGFDKSLSAFESLVKSYLYIS